MPLLQNKIIGGNGKILKRTKRNEGVVFLTFLEKMLKDQNYVWGDRSLDVWRGNKGKLDPPLPLYAIDWTSRKLVATFSDHVRAHLVWGGISRKTMHVNLLTFLCENYSSFEKCLVANIKKYLYKLLTYADIQCTLICTWLFTYNVVRNNLPKKKCEFDLFPWPTCVWYEQFGVGQNEAVFFSYLLKVFAGQFLSLQVLSQGFLVCTVSWSLEHHVFMIYILCFDWRSIIWNRCRL